MTARARRELILVETLAWVGENIAPLVLLPLAAVLVWFAIWKVWLPEPVSPLKTVQTVTTGAPSKRTVTVSTSSAAPSRRSETLEIALLLLGAGAAVIGVFHRQIASIELDKDGLKIVLNKAEASALAQLTRTLGERGADAHTVAAAVQQYIAAVPVQRKLSRSQRRPRQVKAALPDHVVLDHTATTEYSGGLTATQANVLAATIADQLTGS